MHNETQDEYAWVEQWIEKGPEATTIQHVDKFGEMIGKTLKKHTKGDHAKAKATDQRVTRSQIRQVFSKVKLIESKGINEGAQWANFLMLKPYLAYAVSRNKTVGMERLERVLRKAIDKVIDKAGTDASKEEDRQKHFNNFCKLFEAILAYHRAYGGN